jgi:hypothetical protein
MNKLFFKATSFLATITVVFSVVGCASIVSKSQYPVTINSNPSGAKVLVKNEKGIVIHQAITPATLSLNASSGFFNAESYSFEFEKEGYLRGSAALSAGMDPWYIGNILFGGLIGIVIVDPATGAMWKLNDAVCGNLSPDQNFQAAQPAKVMLASNMQTTSATPAARLKELKELKDSDVLTVEEYETRRKILVEQL